VIGFIGAKWRFNPSANDPIQCVEIGNLMLESAYHGRGVMATALSKVRALYSRNTIFIAHVKPTNRASLRLFESAGFWRVPPKRSRK
jgi:RimJ/RimL family protein N-acetyltransferase